MDFSALYEEKAVTAEAEALFREERAKPRLDGWFLSREIVYRHQDELKGLSHEMRAARELECILRELPLSLSDHAVFAGSQSDAFAKSYALINPSFRVETFSGYCDPTAVYNDIEPNETFTSERIAAVRDFAQRSAYVQTLSSVYREFEGYTEEVVFFVEQVTGGGGERPGKAGQLRRHVRHAAGRADAGRALCRAGRRKGSCGGRPAPGAVFASGRYAAPRAGRGLPHPV